MNFGMELSSQMRRFDNTPNSTLGRGTVGTGQQSHQDEGATSHVSPTIGPDPGRLSNIDIDNLPTSYIIRRMQILADQQDELYNSVYGKPVFDVEPPTGGAFYLEEMYPNTLIGIGTLAPDTEHTNSQNHVTNEHAHYVQPMVASPRTSRTDVDAVINSQSHIELPRKVSHDYQQADDNHSTSSTAVTGNRKRKVRTEHTNSQNHVTNEHAHYVQPMVAPPRTSRTDVDPVINSQSHIELPRKVSHDYQQADDDHSTSSTAVPGNRKRKVRCPVHVQSTTECRQQFHASGLTITVTRGRLMKRRVVNTEESSVLITGEIGMKRKRTHVRCPVLVQSTTECRQQFHASGLTITVTRGRLMKRRVVNTEESSVLITGEIGMKRKRTHVDDHVGQTATSKRARPVGVCYPIQRS
ncbi:hypothetical protein ScPMuIL_014186 [Solemya velum]